jgi:hypothetical protein
VTPKTKFVLAVASLGVAVFLLPILFSLASAQGRNGYFDGGRCVCGNPIYIRLSADGYWTYSPGHDVSEHRSFMLQPNTNGWDLIRVNNPRYDEIYIQTAPTGLVARAWMEKGELCETWGTNPRVVRFPRVWNPWPIWWAKLMTE